MHQRISRGAAAVSMVAASALLLAACSSDAETEETTSPAAETSESATATADAEAAAFPVTLDTVMGEVTVESEPQRVVTLGSHEHEYLYALGVAPVAVPVSWQGYDNGTGPWADADREAAGATPELFEPGTTTYDAEAIAAFEPDLIVATYPNHTMTEEEYTLLSGIAPVVTRPATDSEGNETAEWGVTLADELTILAEATGTTAEADQIISDIDAAYAEVRDAHPEWEGLTSQVGGFYEGQAFVYAAADTRNQFLANLGLDVASIEGTDEAWKQISAEQLDVLGELDSVVWQVATTPDSRGELEALPLFESLNTTETGGNLWLTDPVLEGAFFANSPSSIEYSLDAFVPMLEAALDGDPATEVVPFSSEG
ncbi:ABC transporter substrate-binding protein [Demequina sp. NBRC 110055]|uniref:ABC transporter substrate-binding protein n=1 Tax=Demequina sp. NBRC 110055 TaxID=1570344 RepID=UPI0009FD4C37|nr:ABC transporter substrate-binding protein [Demequina sp. NBRC 110055]